MFPKVNTKSKWNFCRKAVE